MNEYKVRMHEHTPGRFILAALAYAAAFVLLLIAAATEADVFAWSAGLFVVGQTFELSAARAIAYDINKRYVLLRLANAKDLAARMRMN